MTIFFAKDPLSLTRRDFTIVIRATNSAAAAVLVGAVAPPPAAICS